MRLIATFAVLCVAVVAFAADDPADTPAAAKTKKLLKTKIKEIEWKDTRLEDAVIELKEEVKGLFIHLDRKGGVSANRKVNVKAKNKTVEEILTAVCDDLRGVGWVVVSKKGDTYDGNIFIKIGNARGTEKKKE
jgi:hypothetical protein